MSPIRAAVPTEWVDRTLAPWLALSGDELGQITSASEDLDQFYERYDVSGISLATTKSGIFLDPNEVIENKADKRDVQCDGGTPRRFIGNGLTGEFRIWTRCGESGTDGSVTLDFVVREDRYLITALVFARLTDFSDVAVMRRALTTFETHSPAPSSTSSPGGQSHPDPNHPSEPPQGEPTPQPETTAPGQGTPHSHAPEPGIPDVPAVPDSVENPPLVED